MIRGGIEFYVVVDKENLRYMLQLRRRTQVPCSSCRGGPGSYVADEEYYVTVEDSSHMLQLSRPMSFVVVEEKDPGPLLQ